VPALSEYRAYTAKELGPFESSTAAGTSAVTQLVDTSWPINSNLDQATLYQDQFLFRPSAALVGDMSRIVKLYTPSGGVLTPDLNWTNAPSAAETYELHGRLDPLKLNSILNEALKELMVEAEFTLTPVLGQTRHSLATVAPWLTNPKWVRQVGFLKTSDDENKIDPYKLRVVRGEAVKISGQVYLSHPYVAFDPSTDVVYVKCLAPAYYQCRTTSSGTFGERSGLAADTYEAPLSIDRLASAALVLAWRRYSQVLEPTANGRLINDLNQAVAWKSELSDRDLEIPELTFLPMPPRFGPLQHGGLGFFDW